MTSQTGSEPPFPFHVIQTGSGLAHYGSHSGTDALGRAIGGEMWVPPEGISGWKSLLPRVMARSGGMPWRHASEAALELRWLAQALKFQPTLIHFYLAENVFYHSPWFTFPWRRTVATLNQPPSLLGKVFGPKRSYRHASLVTTVSEYQRQWLLSHVPEEKVVTIPFGVDTNFFSPGESPRQLDPPLLLCTGHWLRDYPTLAAGWPLIREAFPEASLTIVARPGTAPELQGMEGVTHLSGLPDEALRDLYRKVALFVFPLMDATANNALLEAMACGCPVVGTKVGGVPEYLPLLYAPLVPPGDAQALAAKAIEILKAQSVRERLSREVRSLAVENFSYEAVVPLYHQAYLTAWKTK